MTNTQPTPGPYTVKPSQFDNELLILADETCIASVPLWENDDDVDTLADQSRANAALLALAPAMWEALTHIAGHAAMARKHANDIGWRVSLANVESLARQVLNPAPARSPDCSRSLAFIWWTDDVQEVRPDLTHDQCFQVLQLVQKSHDASVGVSWEVLEAAAATLFPAE